MLIQSTKQDIDVGTAYDRLNSWLHNCSARSHLSEPRATTWMLQMCLHECDCSACERIYLVFGITTLSQQTQHITRRMYFIQNYPFEWKWTDVVVDTNRFIAIVDWRFQFIGQSTMCKSDFTFSFVWCVKRFARRCRQPQIGASFKV